MANPQTITISEGFIVALADLLAFLLIFRIYLKNKRTSALLLSLAWICDLLTVIGYAFQLLPLAGMFILLFSAFFLNGTIELIREENISIEVNYKVLFPLLSLLFAVYSLFPDYMFQYGLFRGIASLYVSHGLATIVMVTTGYLMKELTYIYGRKAKYLSTLLVLFGLHLLPVPISIILGSKIYPIIGSTISLVLILGLVFLTIRLTSSEEFLRLKTMEIHEVEIESGVKILNQEEYKKIKEKLKNVPVLAFVRTLNNIPESWTHYFVTTATKESDVEAISPMNLERMTELSYKYLKAMEEAGSRGIILIDCLEYLIMYNEFTSVMKFLNKLKDFVVSHKGTLILVAEKDAFEDQQWALLTRLLEEAKE
ncbi:hypothetical protein ADU37_CDS09260 [Thermococcus sp. 2319x1]|uniref:DUF835 domain-containing protein n=1 Tax=Thermococcus sp. 2319x1 TaxID=1674923 RepID=UPI00073A9B2C|nr:DUF835 domain-containing protein [Thermococcus sp. 2319x1]ALV62625.1 hypothetical protein ADU37_CDS09260 [Thermococcus sp. 2319x1]